MADIFSIGIEVDTRKGSVALKDFKKLVESTESSVDKLSKTTQSASKTENAKASSTDKATKAIERQLQRLRDQEKLIQQGVSKSAAMAAVRLKEAGATQDQIDQYVKLNAAINTNAKTIEAQAEKVKRAAEKKAIAEEKAAQRAVIAQQKALEKIKREQEKAEAQAAKARERLAVQQMKDADKVVKDFEKSNAAFIKQVNEIEKAQARQEAQSARLVASDKTEGLFMRLTDSIKRATIAYIAFKSAQAIALSAGQFLKLADEAIMLDARLKAVTSSTEEYQTVLQSLTNSANQNRQSLQETIILYTKLQPALQTVGATTAEVLDVTKAFGSAMLIGGASATEAASATLQFSQAMASGILRGDEFNSIAEASPRILQAIADGSGYARNQLRDMAENGLLTASLVAGALTKEMAGLEAESLNFGKTVGGATTEVSNAFFLMTKQVDESLGITSAIADALTALVPVIKSIGEAIVALNKFFDDYDIAIAAVVGGLTAMKGGMALASAGMVSFEAITIAATTATVGFTAALRAALTQIPVIGWLSLGLGAATGALLAYSDNQEEAGDSAEYAKKRIAELTNEINNVNKVADRPQQLTDIQKLLKAEYERVKGAVDADKLWSELSAKIIQRYQSQQVAAEKMLQADKEIQKQKEAEIYLEKIGNQLLDDGRRKQEALTKQQEELNSVRKGFKDQIDDLDAMIKLLDMEVAYQEASLRIQLKRQGATDNEIKQIIEKNKLIDQTVEGIKERDRLEKESQKNARDVEDMVKALENEAKAIEMSNTEREISNALLEIEAKGVAKNSREWLEYETRIRKAITSKETIAANRRMQEQIQRDWEKTWEQVGQSLTDELIKGGKSAKQYIEDTFRTAVLRMLIQPIVQGGLSSLGMGPQGGAGAAGGLSMLSGAKSLYSALTTGFTGLQTSIEGLGADMMLSSTKTGGLLESAGSALYKSASALTAIAAAGAGNIVGRQLTGGLSLGGGSSSMVNAGTAAGTALGAMFGAPAIGAFAGGAVGGGLTRLFGSGAEKITAENIAGNLSAMTGANLNIRTQTKTAGGLIGGASSDTYFNRVTGSLNDFLDKTVKSFTDTAMQLSKSIGYVTDDFAGFIQAVDVSLTDLDPAAREKAIADMLDTFNNALVDALIPSIGLYAKENEASSVTLQRLSADLSTVNNVFKTLGLQLNQISIVGAGMASSLVDLFGGMERFVQLHQTYYQQFYSEEERLSNSMRHIGDVFAELGMRTPTTIDEFRQLVTAQQALGIAGTKAYVAMINISDEFYNTTNGLNKLAEASAQAARQQEEDIKRNLEAFNSALTDLFANFRDKFYTEEQKTAILTQELTNAFFDLGMAIPKTRAEFKKLVESQNIFSESGAATFGKLLNLSNQLDAYMTAQESAAKQRFDSEQTAFEAMASTMETTAKELADRLSTLQSLQQTYTQNFLSDAEQTALGMMRLSDQFAAINQVMPQTRDGFRQLVESQDLSTASGRKAYEEILSLAGAFADLVPAAESATAAIESMLSSMTTQVMSDIDKQIALVSDQASNVRKMADDFSSVAKSLRETSANLGLASMSQADALSALRSQYTGQLIAARAGSVEAMQGLGGSASAFLEAFKNTATTRSDYIKQTRIVQNQLEETATLAESQKTMLDYQAMLLDVNNIILETLKANLERPDPSIDLLNMQLAALGNISSAIQISQNAMTAVYQNATAGVITELISNKNVNANGVASAQKNTSLLLNGFDRNQIAISNGAASTAMAYQTETKGVINGLMLNKDALIGTSNASIFHGALNADKTIQSINNGNAQTDATYKSYGNDFIRGLSNQLIAVRSGTEQTVLSIGAVDKTQGMSLSTLGKLLSGVTSNGQNDLWNTLALSEAIKTTGSTNDLTMTDQLKILRNYLIGQLSTDSRESIKKFLDLIGATTDVEDATAEVYGITDLVSRSTGASQTLLSEILKAMGSVSAGNNNIVKQLELGNSSLITSIYTLANAITANNDAQKRLAEEQAALARQRAEEEARRQREADQAAAEAARRAAEISDAQRTLITMGATIREFQRKMGVSEAEVSRRVPLTEIIKSLEDLRTAAATQPASKIEGQLATYEAMFKAIFPALGQLRSVGDITRLIDMVTGLQNVLIGAGIPIPQYADGGVHDGGLRIVGENGPELQSTGPARIYNTNQLQDMLSSGPDMKYELQMMRQELANLRIESMATASNTAKTTRILDRVTQSGEAMITTPYS